MATYLLTWNPRRWHWSDIDDDIEAFDRQGFVRSSWSTGVTRKIVPGDRVFLMRLGEDPRGIVASGWAVSEVYEGGHWTDETDVDADYGTALYIDIILDILLDPRTRTLPHSRLRDGIMARMNWTPQASGVTIPNDIAAELERIWRDFTVPGEGAEVDEGGADGSVADVHAVVEGAATQVTVTRYERNLGARAICLDVHGYDCSVCGFNFEEAYGDIGTEYIEVHHLLPIAAIGAEYRLNPVADLAPVCPNCHAMIHRRTPPFSIDDLKARIGR